jgi:hypothetical protein
MAHGDDERKAFLEALEKTPFIALASKKAGIARATVYRWMQADVEFKIAVKQALRLSHDKLGEAAYSVVHEKVKEKNFTAARFVLTHYPSLYGVTQRNSDIRKESEEEQKQDWKNMTAEQRRTAALREAFWTFSDDDGNLIMSRQMADRMIEDGHITEDDIVGVVPDDPNDPGRLNLHSSAPRGAVRVRTRHKKDQ